LFGRIGVAVVGITALIGLGHAALDLVPRIIQLLPKEQRSIELAIKTCDGMSGQTEFSQPPKLECNVRGSSFSDESLRLFLCRVTAPKSRDQEIPRKDIVLHRARGRCLLAQVDTRSLLDAQVPYGKYRSWATIRDDKNMGLSSETKDFNLFYKTNLGSDSDLRVGSQGCFIPMPTGGVEISNKSSVEGYVNAYLTQRFDFSGSFSISGCFLLRSSTKEMSGLDIVCVYSSGAYVSFIMPDGEPCDFSIKVGKDPRKDGVALKKRAPLQIANDRLYYFVARIHRASNRRFELQLFVGEEPPKPDVQTPVHSRDVDKTVEKGAAIGAGRLTIEIRLWKPAIAYIYNLEVREE
jgi:hypothetical protein